MFPFDKKNKLQVKHEINMEKRTDDNTRIDILLTPIKENSNSVFVLEIKKTKVYGSIESMIKKAFLQFFSKGYIKYALGKTEENKCKHWEIFHIRAIVFSPDKPKKNWIITIKEFKFNKEGLQAACTTIKKSKNKKNEIFDLLTLHSISNSEYSGQN